MNSLKKQSIALVCLIIAGAAFFALTKPDDLAVGFLMIPILIIFGVMSLLSLLTMKLLHLLDKLPNQRKTIATLIGVSSACILVFQSTGGIVVGDILLLCVLLIVSYVYISKF